MSVEVVLPNLGCGVGEGPHWEDDKQRLLFVDITGNTVYRWDPATNDLQKIQLADAVGCAVPFKGGGYLVGVGRTVCHLDWATEKLTKLHEIALCGRNRFNDGKCDPVGRFWIGSMGGIESYEPLTFEEEKGQLFCLDTDGSFNKHVDRVTVSNGLAWTHSRDIMYYVDSSPGKVMAFDYDVTSGKISNQRIVIDYSKLEEPLVPDGMTIDTNDNLWIAHYGSGKVISFDPKTGQSLRTIQIPAKKTTSCCFGGKGLDELYVTSAADGSTQTCIATMFKVTGLGVKGYPANVFEGNLQQYMS